MERQSEYETNARRIANELGLIVKAAFKGDRCPPWGDNRCIHGDRYRVTLSLSGRYPEFARRRTLSFDFWNSQADRQKGERPGYYDILACVASDMSSPTDPDEVAQELGDMKPSQAIAIAKFAARLQAFFTKSERDKLAEVS